MDSSAMEEYRKRIMHQFDPVYYNSRALTGKHFGIDKMLFEDVEVYGLDSVQEIKDKQILYFSNHISLADFLIEGYVIWNEKLPIPRFLAGENLNHWPFTNLWKKSGAISIDRNMKGHNYWGVFYDVVQEGLEKGESLLVYPEGGRSYSGELNEKLKKGALKQVLKAVDNGADIFGVPIFMDYDNRIEERFLDRVRKNKIERDEHLKSSISYRRKGDYIMAGWENISAGIHDRLYFGWDVFSFLIRPFSQNKGNAKISFGEQFPLQDFKGNCVKDLQEKILQDLKGLSNRNI
jgi:glycerol-3-phosphate O-acyltransferase